MEVVAHCHNMGVMHRDLKVQGQVSREGEEKGGGGRGERDWSWVCHHVWYTCTAETNCAATSELVQEGIRGGSREVSRVQLDLR